MNEVEAYYKALEEKRINPLGVKIKCCRKKAKLSITDVAKTLNTNRSTIQHWDHGRRKQSAKNALQLSELFNIPLKELCQRDKITKETNPPKERFTFQ